MRLLIGILLMCVFSFAAQPTLESSCSLCVSGNLVVFTGSNWIPKQPIILEWNPASKNDVFAAHCKPDGTGADERGNLRCQVPIVFAKGWQKIKAYQTDKKNSVVKSAFIFVKVI